MGKVTHENGPAQSFVAPVLPHNLEAERSILGAALLDNSAIAAVKGILEPEDFFLSAHIHIYAQMVEMYRRGQAIDTVLLTDALSVVGELEAAGGAAYLSQLADGLPKGTNVEYYAKIVKDDACRRLTIHLAAAISQDAFNRGDVFEIQQRLISSAERVRPAQERIATHTAKDLCTMKIGPRAYLLNGLIRERSLNELYSWRGVGKTWAALSIAHAIASGGKFLKWQAPKPSPVLFVDGELDPSSLQQRLSHLGADDNENLKLLCLDMLDDPFPHLSTARAQRIIEDELTDTHARLLILDNLAALAPASNEKEGEEWILIQTWMRQLKRQGISVLFLHHAGYAGHARGTTRREDLLDVVIELKHPKDRGASEGLRFEINFTKTRGMAGNSVAPLEASFTTDLDGNSLWTYRDLEDVRLSQVVKLRDAGTSWRKIEELTGIPHSTAERIYSNSNDNHQS